MINQKILSKSVRIWMVVGAFIIGLWASAAENVDVKENFTDMFTKGGKGYTCCWQLLAPASPTDSSPVAEAMVLSGFASVETLDEEFNKRFIINGFLGDYSASLFCGETEIDPSAARFPSVTPNVTSNPCYFYNVSKTKNSKVTISIKINNTDKSSGYYIGRTASSQSTEYGYDSDGNFYLELSNPDGWVLSYGQNADLEKQATALATSKFVYFNKLRFVFYPENPSGTGMMENNYELSPFAKQPYPVMASFSDDGSHIDIANLYGMGIEQTGNIFDPRRNGYAPIDRTPVSLTFANDGMFTMSFNHELTLTPNWWNTAVNTSTKTITFRGPGTQFTFNGYVLTSLNDGNALIADMAAGSDKRSASVTGFRNRLLTGNLEAVKGTYKYTAPTNTSNSHWVATGYEGLKLSFDTHYLFPITINHSTAYDPDGEENDIELVWKVGDPIKVDGNTFALDLKVPDGLEPLPGMPDNNDEPLPVSFSLEAYDDSKVSASDVNRTLYLKGAMVTTDVSDASLYICRGEINDYSSELLSDNTIGHKCGIEIFSTARRNAPLTKAPSSSHQISINISGTDIPENPEAADTDVFTLYAGYNDGTSRKFTKLRTLTPANITTSVPGSAITATTTSAYTLEGNTLTITGCEPATIHTPDGRTITTVAPQRTITLPAGIYILTTPTIPSTKLLIH